jgi:hypothetical protein
MKLSYCVSVLCLLLFTTSEYLACSCDILADFGKSEQQIVKEDHENAKAVFSGKVTKIILSYAPDSQKPISAEVHFRVITSWKGITTQEAIVHTTQVCCLCGFPFKIGKQYLVYAYGDKDLSTDICTRTKFLRSATEDLKFLGQAEKIVVKEKKQNRSQNK